MPLSLASLLLLAVFHHMAQPPPSTSATLDVSNPTPLIPGTASLVIINGSLTRDPDYATTLRYATVLLQEGGMLIVSSSFDNSLEEICEKTVGAVRCASPDPSTLPYAMYYRPVDIVSLMEIAPYYSFVTVNNTVRPSKQQPSSSSSASTAASSVSKTLPNGLSADAKDSNGTLPITATSRTDFTVTDTTTTATTAANASAAMRATDGAENEPHFRFTGVRGSKAMASVMDVDSDNAGNKIPESLDRLYVKHGSDKSSQCHGYARQYSALFERFRKLPGFRYLEIAVNDDRSAVAMREWFPNAERIVRIDLLGNNLVDLDTGVVSVKGSATDIDLLNRVAREHGPFDLIIDDGTHIFGDVVRTFEHAFPVLLRDGGTYIVEDTNVVSAEACFVANQNAPTPRPPHFRDHLTYFAHRARVLSNDRISPGAWRYNGRYYSNPDLIHHSTTDPVDASIDSVLFGVGFIAVQKKLRKNWFKG